MSRLLPVVRTAAVIAVLLALAPGRAVAGDTGDYERWYVLEMGGKRAGWMRASESTAGELVTTSVEVSIELRRVRDVVAMGITSRFVETLEGEAIEATLVTSFGGTPSETRYVFTPGGVEVVLRQGEVESRQEVPRPGGEWLTPAAASREFQRRVAAGDREVALRVLDPMSGHLAPMEYVYRDITPTTVEAMGKTVPALRVSTHNSLFPGLVSVEHLDSRGVPIVSETDIGIAKMVVRLSERELALADIDPPEIMRSTLIQADRAIRDPRHVRRGRYLLAVSEGDLPDLPSGGAQRWERIDGQSVRVTVDLDGPPAGPAGEIEADRYLGSSAMLDAGDAVIRGLAARATAEAGTDAAARAEAMRRFVHGHIDEKSLAIGFATASETARTREGDCSEHAVLLAAMLRADGIPARVVSGLLYVERLGGARNVFGYHMWAQALVGGPGERRWVDLDATFPADPGYDATHIGLTESSLGDDAPLNGLVQLAPLMGRLRVTIEQTR